MVSTTAKSTMMAGPFWTRFLNRPMQFVIDVIMLAAALVAAYLLRFDFDVPTGQWQAIGAQIPFVVLIQLMALGFFGVYSFIWRYVGLAELNAFAKVAGSTSMLLFAMRLALPSAWQTWRIPMSVIVLDAAIGIGGVLAVRVMRRMLYERYEKARGAPRAGVRSNVLFVGAGRAGIMAAKEVLSRADMDIELKGFVDDEAMKLDSLIHGVRVLGHTRDLPALVKEHSIDHVVITIARATRGSMRRILDICESIPIRVRVIPGLFELLDGKVEVNRIRDVQIEDLLGRDPVILDNTDMDPFLKDRVVMVTGAGGSIGSELTRQIARFAPSRLLLVERSENALFVVDRELRALFPALTIVPVVADVGDAPRIHAVLARYRPAVVFHAAAHKHVPMMEDNPGEAVKNNVLGTKTLADLCHQNAVGTFVMISTDKAVNPTSVMGATKRVAELYIQSLSARSETKFVAVRFGNVLGSNGSVVPIFREQIARGGPVTVTHPEMKRYFMTIPEAAQLVLQAGCMGQGGEIFVLDMGEPVKIVDLARDVILLSGLRPGIDIHIEFTGLRPGEKLFEELSVDDENAQKTRHPKVFIGKLRTVDAELMSAQLDALARHIDDTNPQEVLKKLQAIVPEYGTVPPTFTTSSSAVLRAVAATA